MFLPIPADLTAEKPVMPPLDIAAEMSLPDRYEQMVLAVQNWLLQIWPEAATRYPEQILLPTSLEEYLDITQLPTRNAQEQYAVTFPDAPATAFAPRHQADMADFIGTLNANNPNEVEAVKCIAHEMIHMANPSGCAGDAEMMVCECATELCALVCVAQHVPFTGDQGDLIKSLEETDFYRASMPGWADIVVSVTGSAQDAIELCKFLVYNPPDSSLDLVANLVANKFTVRIPDVLDLLSITPDRYDDNMNQLAGVINQAAMEISGAGSPDTLFWVANNARLV